MALNIKNRLVTITTQQVDGNTPVIPTDTTVDRQIHSEEILLRSVGPPARLSVAGPVSTR